MRSLMTHSRQFIERVKGTGGAPTQINTRKELSSKFTESILCVYAN